MFACRGLWWNRLAMNLEHLKLPQDAFHICTNALLEEYNLPAADVIPIKKRYDRLSKKFFAWNGPSDENTIPIGISCDSDVEFVEVSSSCPSKSLETCGEQNIYKEEYIQGRPLNKITGEKSRFIGYDEQPCTVEQLVIQHYGRTGTQAKIKTTCPGLNRNVLLGWYGSHFEGSELQSIFGLLMWDIIFAEIPDVFQTPFQVLYNFV